MRKVVLMSLAAAGCASSEPPRVPDVGGENAAPAVCEKTVVHEQNVAQRGQVAVWRAGEAFGFTSHMYVNADGAPDSYKPDGQGLSYTCDGAVAFENERCVYPAAADWQPKCRAAFARAKAEAWNGDFMCVFGWEMAGGRRVGDAIVGGAPVVQQWGDPAPGNYVSSTRMTIAGAPAGTQRRYVDSRVIPFFVLSSRLKTLMGSTIGVAGSVGAVYRPSTGALAYAIAADQGPDWQIGEGSIALHRALGSEPIAPIGGVDRAKRNITDDVVYLVFPNAIAPATLDANAFKADIEARAKAAFEAWGGVDKLRACAED
jgi:hypothetical protein